MPAVAFGLVGGLVGAVGGAIAGWMADGPAAGRASALIDGLAGVAAGGVGGWIIAVSGSAAPSAVRFRLRGRTRPFGRRLLAGLGFGFIVVVVGSLMTFAVQAVKRGGTVDVMSLFLESGLQIMAESIAIGLAFSLVMGAGAWVGAPVEAIDSVNPVSLLRMDRSVALAHALIVGPIVGIAGGLAVGQADGHVFGVAAGLAIGLVAGLMAMARTSWGRFLIARVWLAARCRLPWHLIAFLDDAHRRGVLRQAGAAYEFRHVRLRDHLIATDMSGTGGGAGSRRPIR